MVRVLSASWLVQSPSSRSRPKSRNLPAPRRTAPASCTSVWLPLSESSASRATVRTGRGSLPVPWKRGGCPRWDWSSPWVSKHVLANVDILAEVVALLHHIWDAFMWNVKQVNVRLDQTTLQEVCAHIFEGVYLGLLLLDSLDYCIACALRSLHRGFLEGSLHGAVASTMLHGK